MKVNIIKLSNFRNYSHVNLQFNPHLNIIYGNNSEGKTNLIEAIYALALTRSFRASNDRIMIKNGELSTKIEGEVEVNTTNNYCVIINKEGKKVAIDNRVIRTLSEYISNINVVILEPEEQTIFNNTPQVRRKMLNIEISQLKKNYIIYLNNYNQILKQRNFYLRDLYINGNASKDYLDILTNKLIEAGLKIYDMRENFINKINEKIGKIYQKIFAKGELVIKYHSDYKDKRAEDIFDYYEKNYQKEITLGKTLSGIHHDDLIFLLDKKPINDYGSNGQRKNAILAFKLAEIEVIKEEKGLEPILILDDLFSALDNEKIKNIVAMLNNEMQTFITTTDLNLIDKTLLKDASLFKVEDNCIREDN